MRFAAIENLMQMRRNMVHAPSPRSALLPALLLGALIVAAYGGGLRNQYVFDDLMIVRDDPRVRSLEESPRLFVEPLWGYVSEGGRPHLHQYYRPLQTFPLAILYAGFGEQAWPAHLFSLLLHWLNCLLLFFILQRLLAWPAPAAAEAVDFLRDGPLRLRSGRASTATGRAENSHEIRAHTAQAELVEVHPEQRRRALSSSSSTASADARPATATAWQLALLCTALFAVHPGHSEAVFWVSDFAGLGAACCILAIFALHVSGRSASPLGWLLTALLCLAGLWFKESGVLAPILVASHDLLFGQLRRKSRPAKVLWRYAAFVPPFVLYLYLRRAALGGWLPGFSDVPLTGSELLLNAVALVPSFVGTFLWPFAPNMYHDFQTVHGIGNPRFVGGAVILLAGAVVFFLTRKRHRPLALGLLWAIVTAAPYLLVRWPQLNVFAERYLYLPAAGTFLALAYAGQRLAMRQRFGSGARRSGAVVFVGLMTAFLVTDILRASDWRDNFTLYQKTVCQSPRAELIRINLAVELLQRAQYDEGIALLAELTGREPSWPSAWHNLGLLYMGKGDDGRALHAFEQALRRDPSDPKTLLNLGYLRDRIGERYDAVRSYLQLLRLDRHNTKAWYNLAVVAFEEGQFGNADRALARVLSIDPNDRQAAALRERLESRDQRRPRAPDQGATRERCEKARQVLDAGQPREAILRLKAAAWLDEASPLPHQYLANVYYLTGRPGPAIRHQRKALRRDPDNQLYRRNLQALQAAVAGRAGKPLRRSGRPGRATVPTRSGTAKGADRSEGGTQQ